MKHYIIAIVGASGSGKTTISRAMAEAGIPDVVSYTTRDIRPGETDGVEHRFISIDKAIGMLSTEHIAAHTMFGGHAYFTTFRQLIEHQYVSYVIDEDGLQTLRFELAGHEDSSDLSIELITIYVTRPTIDADGSIDKERRDRDAARHALPVSSYDIHVINDAQDVSRLQTWAQHLAVSLLSVLPVRGDVHRCTLHTSDSRIHHIVNTINNVRSAL